MNANDFAARLAVMEAALAKCGKQDTPKRDEAEWVLPSIQSATSEHAELEGALPTVQSVTRKEQVEGEQPLPSVESSIFAQDVREASDVSIVLTARIDRLDVQLDVINDLLRTLVTDQAPPLPPRP